MSFERKCYIFKLPVGPYVDANLRPSDRVSLPTLPEIKKLALAPGSRRVACIVGDKVEDQNSGSLYFGDINYPSEWREKCKLDWPAADIVQLSFSTDDDLYMVFRPQRSGPNHKHEIPVIHVSFRSNQMCPLIIESQASIQLLIFKVQIFDLSNPPPQYRALIVAARLVFSPLSLRFSKSLMCVCLSPEKSSCTSKASHKRTFCLLYNTTSKITG